MRDENAVKIRFAEIFNDLLQGLAVHLRRGIFGRICLKLREDILIVRVILEQEILNKRRLVQTDRSDVMIRGNGSSEHRSQYPHIPFLPMPN